MVFRALSTIAVATAIAASQSALEVQGTVKRVKHEVSCPACRIEFTKVTTLGGASDSVLISQLSRISRDSRGRYFALSDYSQVIVYDSAGKFLRTVGRVGSGPGEFQPPITYGSQSRSSISRVIVGRGDTLIVFHSGTISFFAPDFTFVRSVVPSLGPNNGLNDAFAIPDGTLLIGQKFRTPALAGWGFHQLDRAGKLLRSFGVQEDVLPTNSGMPASFASQVPFALAPDGKSFWEGDSYSLRNWSVPGNEARAQFAIFDVPGLLPGNDPADLRPKGVAQIIGIDTLGMVWIRVKPPRPERNTAGAAAPPVPINRIEVFDPKSGRVIVSQAHSDPMYLLQDGKFAWSGSLDADGIPSVSIWTYRFLGM